MRRALLVATTLLLCASHSFAQSLPGMVGVYADEAGTSCNIVDDGGLVRIHFLHVRTNGATAVQFAVDVTATNWVHLGDTWAFLLVFGTSVDGASIAYQLCLSDAIYLGSASFMGSSAPPCTEISIVPDPPIHETIRAIDCSGAFMIPTGGLLYVNPDLTCQCSVPVEETTWGGIKALYR